MMLAKRWSISKLKKRGDAAPPIPSPQSTGHHDPVEAWRCCHATWQMQGSHPLGEPLVQPYGGGVIDIEFKPIAMRHPLSPILSA
jgi:hypothetical protein